MQESLGFCMIDQWILHLSCASPCPVNDKKNTIVTGFWLYIYILGTQAVRTPRASSEVHNKWIPVAVWRQTDIEDNSTIYI